MSSLSAATKTTVAPLLSSEAQGSAQALTSIPCVCMKSSFPASTVLPSTTADTPCPAITLKSSAASFLPPDFSYADQMALPRGCSDLCSVRASIENHSRADIRSNGGKLPRGADRAGIGPLLGRDVPSPPRSAGRQPPAGCSRWAARVFRSERAGADPCGAARTGRAPDRYIPAAMLQVHYKRARRLDAGAFLIYDSRRNCTRGQIPLRAKY